MKEEYVERIIQAVTDWAIANGLDTTADQRHHLSVVKWVYDKGRRIWGRRKFEEVMRSVLTQAGEPVDESLSLIYDALGFITEAPLCIPIRRSKMREENPGRWAVDEMLCNIPGYGIARDVVKRVERKVVNEETGEEVTQQVTYETQTLLLPWWFRELTLIYDPILQLKYASAVVVNPKTNETRTYQMINVDELAEDLDSGRIRPSPNWKAIITAWKISKIDVVVSGFVCPPPHYGLPCGVRDLFGIGLPAPDKDKAREAAKALLQTASKHPEPDSWIRALAYAMFTNFTFTQKLWKGKPKIAVLVGVRDSGKTTIGRLVGAAFAPRINTVLPSAVSMTPARLGRLMGRGGVSAVVTTPITIDEAGKSGPRGVLQISGETANVLKSYVSSLWSWQTAHGEKWPATPGIIITANAISTDDPALEEKFATVEFTRAIPHDVMNDFMGRWEELEEKLPYLGSYYLNYAVEHWEEVKDTIVFYTSWEQAALDYLNIILQSLDIPPLDSKPVKQVTVKYVSAMREKIIEIMRMHQSIACKEETTVFECVKKLITGDFIPWLKYGGIHAQEVYKEAIGEDPGELYIIRPTIKHDIGVSSKVICMEVGGVLDQTTRNVKFYNSCIITEDTLEEIVSEGDVTNEDEEKATASSGNNSDEEE